ncbi:DUF6489 family protein [Paracoccus fistulariae]|uniref:Uncharacterized protein n=1 Tax=Paracoccus fistulariae TaxID=658446 RepID=A0ABY7SG99_9RHOB|nr:DUF6489 family protein [Paracoccus fistulariae]MDB6181805.1 DUF6489 family protein [Paracoccus fistulariae]WCR05904.1 hypothetical protein JHX87_10215 [Paracoccus fistulariae]
MKITIEIDCTAQEAREVMGLPNIQALQDQWLEKTGAAMMADPDNFSPEALIRSWTKAAAPGFEAMPEMFQAFLRSATPGQK